MKNPYDVVRTILVTEKATELVDDFNKYTFKVSPKANKRDVRRAVEDIFDVTVADVNVMNVRGKRKRLRSAKYGKRPDWKKAVVTLSEGEIDIL
ncbi:MAG: 50S ribosomal protein L23 [Candidatus Pacebacteria bacterium]|nr:50S ribosomal protein L23 [Candidatus Paceibacterota bacterium]